MTRKLRIIGMLMVMLGSFMLWATACSNNKTEPTELTCSADHNCEVGQSCVDGKCKAGTAPNKNDASATETALPEQQNPPAERKPGDCGGTTCAAGEVCRNGKCEKETTGSECKDSDDCKVGKECKSGKCVEPSQVGGYPPPPYGNNVGDVAIPIVLKTCHGDKEYDLKKLYKHKTIKAILITVHTLW